MRCGDVQKGIDPFATDYRLRSNTVLRSSRKRHFVELKEKVGTT